MTPTPAPSEVPPAESLSWAVLDEATDRGMSERGLHRVRTIVQLRRKLPLDEPSRQRIPSINTRAFDADTDRDELLALNNAAFSWHPEQGDWNADRLERALSQPWVDHRGILVHEGEDGHLDGFCWTRVHSEDDPEVVASGDPALGEIWVVGAHPRRHGTGLGPALVAAGLDHLWDLGLSTAILYSEEDNVPARRMYERMGFSPHQRRGGYR